MNVGDKEPTLYVFSILTLDAVKDPGRSTRRARLVDLPGSFTASRVKILKTYNVGSLSPTFIQERAANLMFLMEFVLNT